MLLGNLDQVEAQSFENWGRRPRSRPQAELKPERSKIDTAGRKLRPQAEIKAAGRVEAQRAKNVNRRPILRQRSSGQGAYRPVRLFPQSSKDENVLRVYGFKHFNIRSFGLISHSVC